MLLFPPLVVHIYILPTTFDFGQPAPEGWCKSEVSIGARSLLKYVSCGERCAIGDIRVGHVCNRLGGLIHHLELSLTLDDGIKASLNYILRSRTLP